MWLVMFQGIEFILIFSIYNWNNNLHKRSTVNIEFNDCILSQIIEW